MDYEVPSAVTSFCVQLSQAMEDRQIHEMQAMYDSDFSEITEKFYEQYPWPQAELIQSTVDDDNFLVLYKELFYRHVYARLKPDVADRIESFQNYIDVFNILLGLTADAPEFLIPSGWLWDMLDEFIYQFQQFHQYRGRAKHLTEEEIGILKEHPHWWSAQSVIRYLHALIKKGGIDLNAPKSARAIVLDEKNQFIDEVQLEVDGMLKEDDVHEDGTANFFKLLAHYSLSSLCRVYCLLGDYESALQVLAPLDFTLDRFDDNQRVCLLLFFFYFLSFCP
jgi:translation initiation factor 3 subunit L